MMIRLRVATIFACLLASPLAHSAAGVTDPLKLPGTPPKPAAEAKPVGDPKTAAPAAKPPGDGAAAGSSVPAAGSSVPAAGSSVPAMSEAQKYCQNIAAAAADARFAWQSKKLAEVERQIKQRVEDLEARQAEVKDILARYSDAVKRAKAGLVDIYAKMKAETAAAQISAMDDTAAAAILSQLTAGKASAILNEIAPDRAVKLVTTMSGLVPPADGKKS